MEILPDLRNMNFYVRDSCQSLQPRITLSIKQLFHDYKIKYSEICSICIWFHRQPSHPSILQARQLLMISLTTSMLTVYAAHHPSLPFPVDGLHTCSQLPQTLTAAGAEVWVGAHYFFVDPCQNEGKVF